jgi:formylglycine-generating enzyme required for sulfatase activity
MTNFRKTMTGLLITAAISAAMISCSKNSEPAPVPTLSITPSQSAVVFNADGTPGGNATFTVATNQSAWDAVSSQTWCKVTKTAAGFTVSAAANTAFTAPAPATVTVTAGEATPAVIEVTQAAATGFIETGVSGVSFDMVAVAGGTFTMGAADDDPDAYDLEKPAHGVTLSDFYIGRVEVTQALWLAVTGSWTPGYEPSATYGLGAGYPAYYVSWNDIQSFISALNTQTGKTYRLPTEAEWEYAARGGAQSGGYRYSGSNTIGEVAWYWDNIPSQTFGQAGYGTQPAGTKAANELGIYDMTGNVFEWCSDWYGSTYYTADAQTDPAGPSTGFNRVFRGGGWINGARGCRVSYRAYDTPDYRYADLGFRLACSSN